VRNCFRIFSEGNCRTIAWPELVGLPDFVSLLYFLKASIAARSNEAMISFRC